MEATIGKDMIKVAIRTMEEITDKKVSLTLNDEKHKSNIKTKTYLLHLLSPLTWARVSTVLEVDTIQYRVMPL